MRTLPADLTTAQGSASRKPQARATIRDLRLTWEDPKGTGMDEAENGSINQANALMGDTILTSSDTFFSVRSARVGTGTRPKLKFRDKDPANDWASGWSGWTVILSEGTTNIRTLPESKATVAQSGSTFRVFYVDGGVSDSTQRGLIKRVDYNGSSWGETVATNGGSTNTVSCGLSAITTAKFYCFIEESGFEGMRIWRATENGAIFDWEGGPFIFTGKGQGNQYPATYICATTMGGTDYIVVLDHDDGRAVMVKYANGLWSDPVSVLPIDVVSDPTDTTVPSSQFLPYGLTVVNSQLFLTGRYIRPASDTTYDFDAEVLLRGDGDHWMLDRHHVIGQYGVWGGAKGNNYTGMKAFVVGSSIYLIGSNWCNRSDATNLVGVDAAGKKTTLTDDIHSFEMSNPVSGAAGSLSMQIANADGTHDSDANIREDAEITLEAGWDNGTVSDYVNMGVFSIDAKKVDEAYATDSLSVTARSAAMKKLLDTRTTQSYDYFSQCKIFEAFDDFGGFSEWNVGWEIEDGNLRVIKLNPELDEVPLIVVDTTDWTTMDGVLVKTQFRFYGGGTRSAGIVINATDADYLTVIQAVQYDGADRIEMYNRRDGKWSSLIAKSSDTTFDTDNNWYDMAVLYRAGVFYVWYKVSTATAWTAAGGDFPYTWALTYPAIEAEIYSTDSDEDQAKGSEGDRYADDKGYVGLLASAISQETYLTQGLHSPDGADFEHDPETIVVDSVEGWPNQGRLKIEDEKILYEGLHDDGVKAALYGGWPSDYYDESRDLVDTDSIIRVQQDHTDTETFTYTGDNRFPGHGVIKIGAELIEYDGVKYNAGSNPEDLVGYPAGTMKYTELTVVQRGAHGSTARSAVSNQTPVVLDNGRNVRDCRNYFRAFRATANVESGTANTIVSEETKWIDTPYGTYDNLVGARLEVTQAPTLSGTASPADYGETEQWVADDVVFDGDKTADSGVGWANGMWNSYHEVHILEIDWVKYGNPIIDTRSGNTVQVDNPWLGWSIPEDNPPYYRNRVGYEIWPIPSSRYFYLNDDTVSNNQFNGGNGDYEFRIVSGPGAGYKANIVLTEAKQDVVSGGFTWEIGSRVRLSTILPCHGSRDIEWQIWPKGTYSTEIREVKSVDDATKTITVTEDFTTVPDSSCTYTLTGRGAYGSTPTSHAQDVQVDRFYKAPVRFASLEVYSLGRDYTLDYLLKDVCYRAGVTAFTDVNLAADTGGTIATESNVYYDYPLTLGNTTKKNLEVEATVTLSGTVSTGFAILCRATAAITQVGAGFGGDGTEWKRAANACYEIGVFEDAINPYVFLHTIAAADGAATNVEMHYIDHEISSTSGQHVWRFSFYEDFFSIWCDDRFIWSFHDTTRQDKGYLGIRLLNAGPDQQSITYSATVREATEREPYFGQGSGMTAQEAVQDLIRRRRIWWLEKSDETLEFSRYYTRDDLGAYTDLHELSRVQDDRSIATVVLVVSEEYAFYVDDTMLGTHGYRFLEMQNPDLNTVEECYDEAELVQRATEEMSDQRSYSTQRARLEVEAEDKYDYGGTYYIVNNATFRFALAELSQQVGGRLLAST